MYRYSPALLTFLSWLFFGFHSLLLQAESIKVATINAEGFYDHLPYNTERAVETFKERFANQKLTNEQHSWLENFPDTYFSCDYSNYYTDRIYIEKAKTVIQMIKDLDSPDIVALQEIESAGNNSRLFDIPMHDERTFKSHLEDLGYRYFFIGEQRHLKLFTTAIIAKIDIKPLPSITAGVSAFSRSQRDIQTIHISDSNTILLTVHAPSLKAKDVQREKLRSEYFTSLARAVSNFNKNGKQVIIMGDFNQDHHQLDRFLNISNLRSKLSKPNSRGILYDTWYGLPADKRWESSFQGLQTSLASILVGTAPTEGKFYIPFENGLNRLDSSRYLSFGINPIRWKVTPTSKTTYKHQPGGYSDHLALSITLEKKLISKKQKVKLSDDRFAGDKTPNPLVVRVDSCRDESAIFFDQDADINKEDIKALRGKCVALVAKNQAFELKREDKRVFVRVGEADITIRMLRANSDLPNPDDRRVSREDIENHWKKFPSFKTNLERRHPASPKCIEQLVFQARASGIKYVYGRLQKDAYEDETTLLVESGERVFLNLDSQVPQCFGLTKL